MRPTIITDWQQDLLLKERQKTRMKSRIITANAVNIFWNKVKTG